MEILSFRMTFFVIYNTDGVVVKNTGLSDDVCQ